MVSTVRGDDGFDSAQYVNLLNTYAGRNKIINGNFDVWQRGGGAFTFGYTADQWEIGNVGTTYTINRSTPPNVLQENNTINYVALAITSGSVDAATTVALLKQKIEDVRTLAGQTVTLTFWASSGASHKIGVGMRQVFGTGGSATVVIPGQTTETLVGSLTKQTMTFVLPSVEGKTISSYDSWLELNFYFSCGSNYDTLSGGLPLQDGSWYVSQVQLELGDGATAFETMSIGDTVAKCQRYYVAFPNTQYAAQLYSDATNLFKILTVQFPVTMRYTPHTVSAVKSNVGSVSTETAFTTHYTLIATSTGALVPVSINTLTVSAEL